VLGTRVRFRDATRLRIPDAGSEVPGTWREVPWGARHVLGTRVRFHDATRKRISESGSEVLGTWREVP
jgi:hypothetical protein